MRGSTIIAGLDPGGGGCRGAHTHSSTEIPIVLSCVQSIHVLSIPVHTSLPVQSSPY